MTPMCSDRIFEDLPGLIDVEFIAYYSTEEQRFVPYDEPL